MSEVQMNTLDKKLIRLSNGEVREMTCDEVYKQFRGFVYKQAWKYTQFEFDDAYQIACMGLVKAFNTYDEGKGIVFMTYMATLVMNELNQHHRRNSKHNGHMSFESPMTTDADGHEMTMTDILPDDANVEDDTLNKVETDALKALIQDLPEREKKIIELLIFKEKSQREISSIIGVSQSYVSKILKRAVESLKTQYDKGA